MMKAANICKDICVIPFVVPPDLRYMVVGITKGRSVVFHFTSLKGASACMTRLTSAGYIIQLHRI